MRPEEPYSPEHLASLELPQYHPTPLSIIRDLGTPPSCIIEEPVVEKSAPSMPSICTILQEMVEIPELLSSLEEPQTEPIVVESEYSSMVPEPIQEQVGVPIAEVLSLDPSAIQPALASRTKRLQGPNYLHVQSRLDHHHCLYSGTGDCRVPHPGQTAPRKHQPRRCVGPRPRKHICKARSNRHCHILRHLPMPQVKRSIPKWPVD